MLERYKDFVGTDKATRARAAAMAGFTAPEGKTDEPFDLALKRQIMGASPFPARRIEIDDGEEAALADDAVFDAAPAPEAAETRREAIKSMRAARVRHVEAEPVAEPAAEPARNFAISDLWGSLRTVPVVRDPSLGDGERETPVTRAFDQLRTELLQALQTEGWRRVAVVAPTSGCGTTFSAINLAYGLARIPDCRTLLMDLNQRDPGLNSALGINWPTPISRLLSGDMPVNRQIVKCSESLAVGLNGVRSASAAELLHQRRTSDVLEQMIDGLEPDVVLYDMPAMLEYDDLMAFLPNVDCVLLIADAEKTSADDILECEKKLSGNVPLLGVALNKTARPGLRGALRR